MSDLYTIEFTPRQRQVQLVGDFLAIIDAALFVNANKIPFKVSAPGIGYVSQALFGCGGMDYWLEPGTSFPNS